MCKGTVSFFHKVSWSHSLLNGYCVYFRTALAAMICVFTMYLRDISIKAYCNFKGILPFIHLMGTVIISEGHLQWSSIFKGTVFLWNKYLQSYLFSKILSQSRTFTSQKKFLFICFNDSLSKMMKNSFYFILKALFVFKIFKFLSWLFRDVEKTAWLER